MSNFQNDSIFWIEVEKIKPNPFQPRKEFDLEKLKYLSESIRQYGILQPLVVTRHEIQKEDGGLKTEYELIAGERRLRASKLAGLQQIPAIIRTEEDDAGVKLELAIIENLQREDLNPVDRAFAFQQLAGEFGLKHVEIAKKVGKSREYVSNTIRILLLPEEMRGAISSGKITEGHSRPILMLKDRPEEQATLFKEILLKRLTVRDAESIARKVAVDRVRKKDYGFDPEMAEFENLLAESLGTRVQIEKKQVGGKLTIDFFSNDDLKKILDLVHSNEKKSSSEMLDNYIKSNGIVEEFNKKPEINNQEELVSQDVSSNEVLEYLEKKEEKEENNFSVNSFNNKINNLDNEMKELAEEVAEEIVEKESLLNGVFGSKLDQEEPISISTPDLVQEISQNLDSEDVLKEDFSIDSKEPLFERKKQEQDPKPNNFFEDSNRFQTERKENNTFDLGSDNNNFTQIQEEEINFDRSENRQILGEFQNSENSEDLLREIPEEEESRSDEEDLYSLKDFSI